MKAELMELLEGFSKTLTVWKYNSYVFKVRDYFIPYLLENKQGNDMADNIGNHTYKILCENGDKLVMRNKYKIPISIELQTNN